MMDLLGLLANAAGGLQRGQQQLGMNTQGWGNQQQRDTFNSALRQELPGAAGLPSEQSGWGGWASQMAKPIDFGADLGGSTPSGHFPTLQPHQAQQQPQMPQMPQMGQTDNFLSQWFAQLPGMQQFGGLNWGAAAPWWQNMSQNFKG